MITLFVIRRGMLNTIYATHAPSQKDEVEAAYASDVFDIYSTEEVVEAGGGLPDVYTMIRAGS
jgi:hypothetical protein